MIEVIQPGEHSYLKEINSQIVNWNLTKGVKPSELAHLEMINHFQEKKLSSLSYSKEDKKIFRKEIKLAMRNSVSGKHCPRKFGNYSGVLNY